MSPTPNDLNPIAAAYRDVAVAQLTAENPKLFSSPKPKRFSWMPEFKTIRDFFAVRHDTRVRSTIDTRVAELRNNDSELYKSAEEAQASFLRTEIKDIAKLLTRADRLTEKGGGLRSAQIVDGLRTQAFTKLTRVIESDVYASKALRDNPSLINKYSVDVKPFSSIDYFKNSDSRRMKSAATAVAANPLFASAQKHWESAKDARADAYSANLPGLAAVQDAADAELARLSQVKAEKRFATALSSAEPRANKVIAGMLKSGIPEIADVITATVNRLGDQTSGVNVLREILANPENAKVVASALTTAITENGESAKDIRKDLQALTRSDVFSSDERALLGEINTSVQHEVTAHFEQHPAQNLAANEPALDIS